MWVTRGTVHQGLRVIFDAVLREVDRFGARVLVHHNAQTGQRLYLGADLRLALLAASFTAQNGSEDYDAPDATGAYAIVECGLFGAVTYG